MLKFENTFNEYRLKMNVTYVIWKIMNRNSVTIKPQKYEPDGCK